MSDAHAILWLDEPGEHLRCLCGRWRYDNPRSLEPGADINDIILEFHDHVQFEVTWG